MCTLIAIHRGGQHRAQTGTGAPLIVAANRDEFYDRPAEGPAIRSLGGRQVLAPMDLRAGGTWLGLNDESVFAAVTNLRNDSPDPQRRSRGWIVMDALREPTAARAADMLKALPEETYNPFQCFVADSKHAFRLVYRDAPRIEALEPGMHVIGNVDPLEEPAPKVDRIRRRVAGIEELGTKQAIEELARVCAEHGTGGVADTCVHAGEAYGTRSSILLALPRTDERTDERTADGREEEGRLLVADGAPCKTEYEDQTDLLAHLRQVTAGTRGS